MCVNLKFWGKDIGNVMLQTDAVILGKTIMPFQQHFGLTEGGCFSLTAREMFDFGGMWSQTNLRDG